MQLLRELNACHVTRHFQRKDTLQQIGQLLLQVLRAVGRPELQQGALRRICVHALHACVHACVGAWGGILLAGGMLLCPRRPPPPADISSYVLV